MQDEFDNLDGDSTLLRSSPIYFASVLYRHK